MGTKYIDGILKVDDSIFEGGVSLVNKYAKDSSVVHKSGTETITGNKTFNGVNTFNGELITTSKITANGFIYNNKGMMGGYLELHPEANTVAFPFYMNDLAYLQKKGGSCTITGFATNDEPTNSRIFNGKSNYSHYTLNNTSDTVTILVKTHTYFSWGSSIGINFGSSNWRAKNIKIELGYATTIGGDPATDAWVTVGETTDYPEGNYFIKGVYGPTTSGDGGKKWNTIRFTLTNFNGLNIRIAGIYMFNYSSEGLNTTLLGKDGGEMYGHIYPYKDGGMSLGTADKAFDSVYTGNVRADYIRSNTLSVKNIYPQEEGISGTIGSSTHRFTTTYSQNIDTNYIAPMSGHKTGGIGASDKYWNTIYVSNVRCDSVIENGSLLKNKYLSGFNVRLGRTGTTNANRACSFCTMTFSTTWQGYEFEVLITDKESKDDVARYSISGRSTDSTTKINCSIKQIYTSGSSYQIFAVQSDNVLTFFVKSPYSYRDVNLAISYSDISSNLTHEFAPGTWTEEIPEATFTERNILDTRYNARYLSLTTNNNISGNIIPTTTDTIQLGAAEKKFLGIYVRNIQDVEYINTNFIDSKTFRENGVYLTDKYLQKDNTQSFNIRASSNSDYKTVSFDYDLGLNVEGNITTENIITSGWLSTDSLEIYSAEDTGGTPERITTIDAEGLVGYREFNDFKNDLGLSNYATKTEISETYATKDDLSNASVAKIETSDTIFGANDEGYPTIVNKSGDRIIGIGSGDEGLLDNYMYYTFPEKQGTVALMTDIPTKSSWNYDDSYVKYSAAQTLTDAQKTQARSNIGAGTSNFTGYTSSNKLSTSYIQNDAKWTSNAGTVTSVQVQATSPVVSSSNAAQTSSLNTTISLADGYGDTKNPYAPKTKNWVLAAPNGSAGVPSFRSLVAADIPSLPSNKITAMTGYSKASSASAIKATDSLNTAIGKLEKALDGKGTSNLTLGTTSTTAAAGNHTHKYAGASIEGGAATVAMSTYGGCNFTDIMHENKNALTFDGSETIIVTAHNVGAVPVKMANDSTKSEIQMTTNALTMNSVSLADDGTASYIRLRPSRAEFYCDKAGLNITASGTNILKLYSITAPTSSGGTTYGLGTSGQVLKSNGTSVYWANDSTTSGSGDTYYMHRIALYSTSSPTYRVYITLYNKSSTKLTYSTLVAWLTGKECTSQDKMYSCTGMAGAAGNFAMGVHANGNNIILNYNGSSGVLKYTMSQPYSFTDNVYAVN